jgi:addiction module HigA family antidote
MPRIAIHPGEHLSEQLQALDMSAAEFARRIGVPTNRVTEVINGKRAITADTALRLARAFNTSARFWMNLQVLFDLRTADSAEAAKILTKIAPVHRAAIVPALPARRRQPSRRAPANAS